MSTIDPTAQAHHHLTTTTRPLAEIARAAELQKDARQRAALLTWDAIES